MQGNDRNGFLRRLTRRAAAATAAAAMVAGAGVLAARAAERAVEIPPAAMTEPAAQGPQTVVLAGGCFWGVQGVYQHVKGVESAVSGYTGGTTASPTYHEVSTGRTGHAESVKVTFDPAKVSYGRILQIFFSVVQDPTQLDRQGPDTGTQYRSAIFTTTAAQRKVADAYIAQLDKAGVWKRPIVTTVQPLGRFYEAEAYHQDYATLHPDQPYIALNDIPKIDALKRMFPANYRANPVTVAAAQ
ncbi:MAG: peptide-methionine (S)-S-oxide reductase MsrA [Alphaproteobacteria bacterium]|nr:peptide-methionine (S)-S-oxide reductase MsrA [Alphaproteobacteria bacterium]